MSSLAITCYLSPVSYSGQPELFCHPKPLPPSAPEIDFCGVYTDPDSIARSIQLRTLAFQHPFSEQLPPEFGGKLTVLWLTFSCGNSHVEQVEHRVERNVARRQLATLSDGGVGQPPADAKPLQRRDATVDMGNLPLPSCRHADGPSFGPVGAAVGAFRASPFATVFCMAGDGPTAGLGPTSNSCPVKSPSPIGR